jgi:hypothetical protein
VEIEYTELRSHPYETVCHALKKLHLMKDNYQNDLQNFLVRSEIKQHKVNEYNYDAALANKLSHDLKIGYDLWHEIKENKPLQRKIEV